MIERTTGFKVGDKVFPTLEDAQQQELLDLLHPVANGDLITLAKAAETLVINKNKVTDILTTTKNSRPRARKTNGGSKKRTVPLTSPPAPAGEA